MRWRFLASFHRLAPKSPQDKCTATTLSHSLSLTQSLLALGLPDVLYWRLSNLYTISIDLVGEINPSFSWVLNCFYNEILVMCSSWAVCVLFPTLSCWFCVLNVNLGCLVVAFDRFTWSWQSWWSSAGRETGGRDQRQATYCTSWPACLLPSMTLPSSERIRCGSLDFLHDLCVCSNHSLWTVVWVAKTIVFHF